MLFSYTVLQPLNMSIVVDSKFSLNLGTYNTSLNETVMGLFAFPLNLNLIVPTSS